MSNAPQENLEKLMYKVNGLRKTLGMRIIKRGERICLCCEKIFFSYDLAATKLCPSCRTKKDY